MCGIAGYMGRRAIDASRLEAGLRSMRHRGPDATGVFSTITRDGVHVHLLHARLGVVDLDPRANQPMHYGTKTLICNGELYNHHELRSRFDGNDTCESSLPGSGGTLTHAVPRVAPLRTASDTEVLLRVLAEHGVEGLDACEGMWAFALYDEADGTVTLCRDRFGEKPLFVQVESDGVYFGSEIKIISALTGRKPSVNLTHVRRYLVNGYKSLFKRDETFYENVCEVSAGSCWTLRGGTIAEKRRYWSFPMPGDEPFATYTHAVNAVRSAVIRAVELRLRADVPVGFLLSGGMDSNTIAAVARRELGAHFPAFTIISSDDRYDERIQARQSASAIGVELIEVEPAREPFLSALRTLVRQHDGPVITISYMAHACLLRRLSLEGCKVSISGSGGDELFAGYYDHHLAHLYELRHDCTLHAQALKAWIEHMQPYTRNPLLQDADRFLRDPSGREHIYLDRHVFSGFLRSGFDEPFEERHFTNDLLRNRMLNELFHEAIPPILREDDHNAMAVSVENRSPLLDRSLFELSLRIPTGWLIRDGYGKAVLRDAMVGIVPESVRLQRRKVGFNLSIDSLLDRRDPAVRREILSESPIDALVKRDAIKELLDARELLNSRSKFLFSYLSAKMFLEECVA